MELVPLESNWTEELEILDSYNLQISHLWKLKLVLMKGPDLEVGYLGVQQVHVIYERSIYGRSLKSCQILKSLSKRSRLFSP